MAGFSREVARRIFAEELKRSNYSFREGEDSNQYAPSYLLTPTGAKCNRVFIVGTLTEKDDIGSDTEYWRGRLVDPTGSILIYAGQYQPEAAQILASMEAPAFVAVVGKPNLYQTEDGNIIISVRAEAIQRVDKATRDQWIMDTARRSLERISALKSLEPAQGGFATADSVAASTPAQDAQRAMEHYHPDLEQYRMVVIRALSSLRSDLAEGASSSEKIGQALPEAPEEITPDITPEVKPDLRPPSSVDPSQEPAERPGSKKPKSKKNGGLTGWPERRDEEEVETIHLGKKS